MATAWSEYQEEAAEFFRSLGLEADTNVTIKGVRTEHDIDVVVRSRHAGFEVTWIVECKHWKSRVTKLHVLGLREIVADVGADRGILLAERGFQRGASEAATLTNVHLTSLSCARSVANEEIFAMRLTDLYDRVEACDERYWDIPKDIRIDHDLRPDYTGGGYSGTSVISLARDLLSKAFRGSYPFEIDSMSCLGLQSVPGVIGSAQELVNLLEPMINDLEFRLEKCMSTMSVVTK